MTTRQKRCFNFDKTLILECSVEWFTQVKTPQLAGVDRRTRIFEDQTLLSSCYLLFQRSVQNQAAFCTFFQGLYKFLIIHSASTLLSSVRLFSYTGRTWSPRNHFVVGHIGSRLPSGIQYACFACLQSLYTAGSFAESFKIFISLSIKKIAILLKNMSAGKKGLYNKINQSNK